MGILTALLSRTQTYKKLAILVFAKTLLPREFQVLLIPLEFGCDCDTGSNPLFYFYFVLISDVCQTSPTVIIGQPEILRVL